ncbi:MAG: HdeD family acid-resistance protein [Phocaeicola sp.]
MKNLNYPVVRALCSIMLGVILVGWPGVAVIYLVLFAGALFTIPGIFAIFGYLTKGRTAGDDFPVVGLGSALFGGWLLVMPDFFVSMLMTILGAAMALAGVGQIVQLVSASKSSRVPLFYYLFPILILVAGILVLVNPFEAATLPFTILGVSSLVYGLSSLVALYQFRKKE